MGITTFNHIGTYARTRSQQLLRKDKFFFIFYQVVV